MKKIVDVSVVIPYFNSSSTIDRAIDSINAQTVMPAEVIIVDDCSNSTNRSYLSKFEMDEKIKVIYLERNVGPGEARNEGIKSSNGKYIAFLDSDDIWEKRKIEVQHSIMEDNGFSFTCHDSKNILSKSPEKFESVSFIPINKYAMLLINKIKTRTVMLNNEICKKIHFRSGMRYSEDYDYWLSIIGSGHQVYKISGLLAYSFGDDLASGLSSNLVKMYFGELSTLWNQKIVKFFILKILLIGWATIKFSRRLFQNKILYTFRRKN